MLDKFSNLRGHLKIEKIKNDIPEIAFEDDNMIMSDARISMAEIFANLTGVKHAHKFMLGTQGHKDESIYTPKDSTDGFVKTRNRMFSQSSPIVYSEGDLLDVIHKNDILKFNNPKTSKIDFIKYTGETKEDFIITSDILKTSFTKLEKEPYFIEIDFELPGNNIVPPDQTNTPDGSPYDVQVTQQDTSVTFVVTIPMSTGNGQYINDKHYGIPTSVFTEASLWVNDRIFSLKTFQGITKDDSIKIRLTWTITF